MRNWFIVFAFLSLNSCKSFISLTEENPIVSTIEFLISVSSDESCEDTSDSNPGIFFLLTLGEEPQEEDLLAEPVVGFNPLLLLNRVYTLVSLYDPPDTYSPPSYLLHKILLI